jgi:putative sterol carrier protein
MLSRLVKGMQDAGAEVETVNLRQKKINHCLGCFTCWTKTPGVCVHKDDMSLELYPKWLEADIVVYASPLYHYTVNADMKAFIERTLPILKPYLERANGITSHPLRCKPPEVVLLSVAGFPDDSVFDALSYWAKVVFGRHGGLLAEIYRPAAEGMIHSGKKGDILAAVEQGGKEIVEQRHISPATMAGIKQPIAAPEVVASTSNAMWQTLIDQKITMAEVAKHHGGAPRPDSIESFMAMMSFAFNPGKAAGKQGVLQFNFSGEKAGDCFLTLGQDGCSSNIGVAKKADCTVDSPFEVWADIIEGKLDGGKAAMDGKYKVNGDITLLMLFGGD